MARIRSIKPEFWTSEQIAECSPITRLMFIGMWNFCDDYGVIPASVKRLKMQLFPADESIGSDDIRRMITELSTNDLLQEYDIEGRTYWYVTGWARNQNIESPTGRYPMPDGSIGKTIRGSRANNSEYRRSPQDQKTIRDQNSANDRLTFDEVEPKGKGKGKGKGNTLSSPDGFERFWDAYGKKTGKQNAIKEWVKVKPNHELIEKIVSAATAYSSTREVKFRKDPERWIKEQRWEDEIVSDGSSISSVAAEFFKGWERDRLEAEGRAA